MNKNQPNKTPAEIIAGALHIFMHGDNGQKLKKARWNNRNLIVENDNQYSYDNPLDTYCALGAIGMAAQGDAGMANDGEAARKAADIVAECIPMSTQKELGFDKMTGDDIPEWNDGLSRARGFTSIKRTFCKALKVALERERPRTAQRKRKKAAKRAA